jgi:hypothetical protein
MNSEVMDKVFKLDIFLKNIMMLNVTDTQLSIIITKENTNNMYIQTNINLFYDEQILLDIYKMNPIVEYYYNLYENRLIDCDQNFEFFNDTLINLMIDNEGVRYETLKMICKDYYFMNLGIDQILSDIIYEYQSILHSYSFSQRTYSEIQDIFKDDNTLSKISTFVLFMFRPIQTFIEATINMNSINDSNNNYLTFTFVYLSFNIMVDMVLGYIIFKKILQKAANISRYYDSLVNALKVYI